MNRLKLEAAKDYVGHDNHSHAPGRVHDRDGQEYLDADAYRAPPLQGQQPP
jgi:hypothetical protein